MMSLHHDNPALQTLDSSSLMAAYRSFLQNMRKKNELNAYFQQKFVTGSYGVGIGCAWYSWKASETFSSFIQKKKLKKK
jgi:hypothetical protein